MTAQTTVRPAAGRPSPRLRFVVLAIAALSAACLVGAVRFKLLYSGASEGTGELVALLAALYAYLLVGLVLLAKTPRNPLSWVMTAVGVLTSVGSFATAYADYAFAPPGHPLPGATFAAWINSWWWFPTITLVFLFVPLLFPDGTPLSPRWRWLTYASVGLLGLMLVTAPLNPVLAGDNYRIDNPIGVAAIGDIEESALGDVVFFALILLTVAALLSLILRVRRSRGVARQQMKWFVFGAAIVIVTIILEEGLKALGLEHLVPDSNVFFAFTVAMLPVTIGIAVLKYRLYEIDRVISRTLSYALLTAVLLSLYLGAVSALTAITAPVTRNSPLAVATATLLAAAAFGPARRRIQDIVDRRFNRARYDASQTVDELRARLRDELDLAAIAGNVTSAVDRTVAPSRVVVWLRTEGSR